MKSLKKAVLLSAFSASIGEQWSRWRFSKLKEITNSDLLLPPTTKNKGNEALALFV